MILRKAIDKHLSAHLSVGDIESPTDNTNTRLSASPMGQADNVINLGRGAQTNRRNDRRCRTAGRDRGR